MIIIAANLFPVYRLIISTLHTSSFQPRSTELKCKLHHHPAASWTADLAVFNQVGQVKIWPFVTLTLSNYSWLLTGWNKSQENWCCYQSLMWKTSWQASNIRTAMTGHWLNALCFSATQCILTQQVHNFNFPHGISCSRPIQQRLLRRKTSSCSPRRDE